MSQCPNCGTQVTARFCPNCGAQMPDQTAAAAMPTPPQQARPGYTSPAPYAPQPGPQGVPPQPGFPPQQPGYGPQPGAYPMPPQKKSSLVKWLGIGGGVVVLLAIILMVLSAIGGSTPVSTPVIATSKYTDKMPSNMSVVPANSQYIYAIVEVNTSKAATVEAKWYLNGEHAADLDTPYDLDAGFHDVVQFHLTAEKAFPAGQYKVEVYLDGTKQTEQTFQVK